MAGIVQLLIVVVAGNQAQAAVIQVLPVIQVPVQAEVPAVAVLVVLAAEVLAVAAPAESGKVFDNNIM